MMATTALASMATLGDIRGEMYGTKHKGSKTPAAKKISDSRAKAKAAKKAKKKNRGRYT
jgi:hypothetical protein